MLFLFEYFFVFNFNFRLLIVCGLFYCCCSDVIVNNKRLSNISSGNKEIHHWRDHLCCAHSIVELRSTFTGQWPRPARVPCGQCAVISSGQSAVARARIRHRRVTHDCTWKRRRRRWVAACGRSCRVGWAAAAVFQKRRRASAANGRKQVLRLSSNPPSTSPGHLHLSALASHPPLLPAFIIDPLILFLLRTPASDKRTP